jgi:hypothetical protein
LEALMPRISITAAAEGFSGRLDRKDAAAFLGFTPKTLAEWKRLGIGPACHKVGGRVFYRVEDLKAFIRTRGQT